MTDLAQIAKIPSVATAVLGDVSGAFYDAIRETDGESVAAVTGFISSSLALAGEQLGLGPLARVSFAGGSRAAIIAVDGAVVITLSVNPPSSLPSVERSLDLFHGARG